MYKLGYIKKGKPMPLEEMASALKEKFEEIDEYDVLSLYNLNEAIINDREVFAVCKYEPRNLDSGSHAFDIYHVTTDHQTQKICFLPYMGYSKALGYKLFTSRAIGMDRVFDATNDVFSLLKKITGSYGQIS